MTICNRKEGAHASHTRALSHLVRAMTEQPMVHAPQGAIRGEALTLTRVARRHYGRYLATLIILTLIALIVRAFVHGKIDWPIVERFLFAPMIVSGIVNTIILTFLSMGVGLVLGLAAALMKQSSNPVMRYSANGYTFFFRAIPVLLQLLLWFNLALVFPTISVPGLFSVQTTQVITPFVAALLAFGIQNGAYTSEVIRGGLMSVTAGQIEAALSIGMTRAQAYRRVVIPQAMKVIVPPIGNELIGMLKYTSLASVIQYRDVIYQAQSIYYTNGRVIELLIVATFWYLAVVSVLSLIQAQIEKHFGKAENAARDISE